MLKKIKLPTLLNLALSLLIIYLAPVVLTLQFHKSINLNSILGFSFGLLLLLYTHYQFKYSAYSLLIGLGISAYFFFTLSKALGLIFLSVLLLLISLKRSQSSAPLTRFIYVLTLFLYVLSLTILQIHLISRTIMLPLIFPFFTIGLWVLLREFQNSWLIGIVLLLLNLYFFLNGLNPFQILLYLLVIIVLSLDERLPFKLSLETYLLALSLITML